MAYHVELHNINKHYSQGENCTRALNNVSFNVGKGEFLAIKGPSGSGKSTLLNICGLIDQPDEGQLRLKGQAVEQFSPQTRCDYRRRNIGFIFQRHQLIPAMTVYENIAYPLRLNHISPAQIKYEVELFLDKIGLLDRRKHFPKQLSGGECQRVGIARALIKKPQLIIADEPSANLDQKNTLASLALMRELNQENGASFIIASHDNFVIEHCDRKIELIDGRLAEAS